MKDDAVSLCFAYVTNPHAGSAVSVATGPAYWQVVGGGNSLIQHPLTNSG